MRGASTWAIRSPGSSPRTMRGGGAHERHRRHLAHGRPATSARSGGRIAACRGRRNDRDHEASHRAVRQRLALLDAGGVRRLRRRLRPHAGRGVSRLVYRKDRNMLSNDATPGVEERYASACAARTLVTEGRRAGASDVLIAAGWSGARLGLALLRLHSECAAASGARGGHAIRRAGRRGAQRLRGLAQVHEQLVYRAELDGASDPALLAAKVLAWWLDPVCRVCSGRRWRLVPGTPSLSGALCGGCRGHGAVAVPCGEDGRRLAAYLDDCLAHARRSLHGRLRGGRNTA